MLIIDGHNLIGAMSNLSLDDFDCKEKLLELLEKYQRTINERIIVVFDGSDYLNAEKYQRNRIEVCYPPKNCDADYVIIKLIEKYKNNLGVRIITSDNELKSLAKRRGLITQKSRQFSYEIQNVISQSQFSDDKKSISLNVNDWLNYFNTKKEKYGKI